MGKYASLSDVGHAIGGMRSQAKLDREDVRILKAELAKTRLMLEMLCVWCAFLSTLVIGLAFA